jgi:hypothetical protein
MAGVLTVLSARVIITALYSSVYICETIFLYTFFVSFPLNTTAETQKGEEVEKNGGFYKWRDAILVKSNHIISPPRTHKPGPRPAPPRIGTAASRLGCHQALLRWLPVRARA